MPWITVIDENEAQGELKHVYDDIMGARGKNVALGLGVQFSEREVSGYRY